MRRLVASMLVALAAMFAFVFPVGATLWCKADPVIQLNGTLVDVTVAIPLEHVPLVNGPVVYTIRTPKSTARQLVIADPGFNAHGSVVQFTDGAGTVKDCQIPTVIEVRVPIDESRLPPGAVVPTELTILPTNAGPVVVGGTSKQTTAELLIQGCP